MSFKEHWVIKLSSFPSFYSAHILSGRRHKPQPGRMGRGLHGLPQPGRDLGANV